MSKFYTAFLYDTEAAVHCTHKYLGTLDNNQLIEVTMILDSYFKKPRTLPRVAFDQPDLFGFNKDIRVLVPTVWNTKDFLPDLREKLQPYKRDDYDYRPHISTGARKLLVDRFAYYALMTGPVVVKAWRPNRA